MRYITLIIFLVFLTSCSKSTDTKIEEMVTAKNKWLEVSANKDYSYTMQVNGHHVDSIKQISVVAGKTNSKKPTELATIQDLFELAFDTIKDSENEIEIIYNSIYGYPSQIEIERPGVINGQITIVVHDLVFKEI